MDSPNPFSCPGRKFLEEFSAGRLDEPTFERIAEHVSGCSACQALLAEVEAARPALLQPPVAEDDNLLQEQECARLEEAAKEFKPANADDTPTGNSLTKALERAGFRIDGVIGSGPNGLAFVAEQVQPGRVICIKAVSAAHIRDPGRWRRSQRLTEKLAQRTGTILPMLEVFAVDRTLCVISPYIEGCDLARIIRSRRLLQQSKPPEAAHPYVSLGDDAFVPRLLSLLDSLVAALAAVHGEGHGYREVKPSNCLVDFEGSLRLSDFRFSDLLQNWTNSLFAERRPAWSNGLDASASGVRVHSSPFISPEQWEGHSNIDERADVFRLGVTLYQALTLELPFGQAAIHSRRPLPSSPSRRQPCVPKALDAVVLKALHPDRSRRYRSGVEVLAAWSDARGRKPAG
jgi:serine/threonine protein kinase